MNKLQIAGFSPDDFVIEVDHNTPDKRPRLKVCLPDGSVMMGMALVHKRESTIPTVAIFSSPTDCVYLDQATLTAVWPLLSKFKDTGNPFPFDIGGR
jgi:hypothetical protein